MMIPQTEFLNETRRQARELYLKRQRAQVIDQLKGATIAEKKAVIRHIDSFLSSTTPDGKAFWLKVRREIEREIERQLRSERSN